MGRTDYMHFRQNSIIYFYYNIADLLSLTLTNIIVKELTLTNIIAKYDQNLKFTKK